MNTTTNLLISRRRMLWGLGVLTIPAVGYLTNPFRTRTNENDSEASRFLESNSRVSAEPSTATTVDWVAVRDEAITRTDKHLKNSQNTRIEEVRRSVAPVNELFYQAKQGCPALAEVAMGFYSKWAYAKDWLPFSSRGNHERYLKAKMAEFLFSPEELEEAIKRSITAHVEFLQDELNELLVDLQADLADLPIGRLPAFSSNQQFQETYRRQMKQMDKATQESALVDVGQFVVDAVAAKITARVLASTARRVATSAGMIGVGVKASPYTLGASLLIALILDSLVSMIWDWWADPKGKLEEKLTSELESLKHQILLGDETELGLIQELKVLTWNCERTWRRTIVQIMNQSGPQTENSPE